ncbi:MAG TPA: AbrB/MazE/SpoVT family DNA-binding domain-containing protein [Candidatus Thiothrix moscowensis]|uniref:antitoxin n=1 Tax=unclassified Thiothrix TaxID=2636184 RepID=UPI0025D027B7|nr:MULTISPECIES: AbrB/MazE/SpoVT family DNA-binding domain-containing protein [unclassified Thiothrix]HRJ53798.1 AbrB/MazE/SpoVT family DNA-binding domain-containing protein [Candidatus Thiothrix moscowensis]HRJ93880.1 AbrB/MazE/SpoVT family DNA-binding domain-containing protein [Candidatus Thiothrix moscowensis]
MLAERHVRLFRNGRNQAIRIPREYELPGNEVIIRREGNCLVIEPLQRLSLLAFLAASSPASEDFPRFDDQLPIDDVVF